MEGRYLPFKAMSLNVAHITSAYTSFVVVYLLSHVQFFATSWTMEPNRLLCPWDFPGKNTGVDCHFLLRASS